MQAQVIPTLLGVLLAVLSVVLIYQGIKKMRLPDADGTAKGSREDMISVVLTCAVILIYVAVLDTLGFILATIVYLFCQMMVLAPKNKRNPVLFIVISIVFTVLIFIAFRIGLKQLLPRGIIENLIGF
ncbi:MAG: tripartite tricarboxylate transporter TctB family protein [Clostridia bacterium]|nr:tripartite tricarboxylate transporter TctB family protein [Clostridia bacterium]